MKRTALVLVALLSATLLVAQAPPAPQLPAPAFTHPADNPAAQAFWDVFTPNLGGQADTSPLLSNVTSQASPDRVVVAAGANLAPTTNLLVYGQTTAANAITTTSNPIRVSGNVGQYVVDAGQVPNSMYLVWAEDNGKRGPPLCINKAEVWWSAITENAYPWSADGANGINGAVVSGDMCRVFGRNLRGAGGQCSVYVEPDCGGGQYASVTYADPYRVEFTVPANLQAPSKSPSLFTPAVGPVSFKIANGANFSYPAGTVIALNGANSNNFVGTALATVAAYAANPDGSWQLDANITEVNGHGGGAGWYVYTTYLVWAHNGHGGQYGWCDKPTRIVNVTAYNFGATVNLAPSGGDDYQPLRDAILSFGNKPGTIQLNGNYQLSKPPGVITSGYNQGIWLKGTAGSTTITPIAGSTANYVMSFGVSSKATDIIFDFTSAPKSQCNFNGSIIKNCSVICNNNNTPGGWRYIYGCKLVGGGAGAFLLYYARNDLTVENNQFYQTTLADGSILVNGGYRHAIIGNTSQDLDATQQPQADINTDNFGIGRLFWGNTLFGSHYNVYIGGNKTILSGPRAAGGRGIDSNKGENACWEGMIGYESRPVTSVSGRTISLGGGQLGKQAAGYLASVTKGSGIMQWGMVSSTDADSITLDRDWLVPVDTTSQINVARTVANVAIYNNDFQGNGNFNSAVSGVKFFGGGTNLNVESNRISGMATGIAFYSMNPSDIGGNGAPTTYWSMVKCNKFDSCAIGHTIVDDGPSATGEQVTTAGIIFQDSHMTNHGFIGADFSNRPPTPVLNGIDSLIHDHCYCRFGPTPVVQNWNIQPIGVRELAASKGGNFLTFYGNRFSLGDGTLNGSQSLLHKDGFTEILPSQFLGFQK